MKRSLLLVFTLLYCIFPSPLWAGKKGNTPKPVVAPLQNLESLRKALSDISAEDTFNQAVYQINDLLTIYLNKAKRRIDSPGIDAYYNQAALKKSVNIFHGIGSVTSNIFANGIVKLLKAFDSSRASIVYAIIYLARLEETGKIIVSYYNVHRLLLAAMLLAIKYNDDFTIMNNHYANHVGLQVEDVNQLETAILLLLDFRTHIRKEELYETAKQLLELEKEGTV